MAIGDSAAGLVLVRGKKREMYVYIGICFTEHGKNWGRDMRRNYQLCGAKTSGMEKSVDLLWWCDLQDIVHVHGNTSFFIYPV